MSPTITAASFFFVRPQNACVVDTFSTELLDRQVETHLSKCKGSPLSCTQFLTKDTKPEGLQGPPFDFFGTVRIFPILSPKGPSSFLIFCSKLKFQKAQRVSPFYFFGNETVSKFSFFEFFKKLFVFF